MEYSTNHILSYRRNKNMKNNIEKCSHVIKKSDKESSGKSKWINSKLNKSCTKSKWIKIQNKFKTCIKI
ncbi:hypothetical protein PIROE2DRAFT_14977 [Piromyces sp. E2]|nr:hypothetical protein PIROE2DRAFT_14977 [Piromyces sp. E2]|eukprot:OUM59496.1 hypothetical protein PIROE2DRAFT_14977 [Piromyces sp. E2]